MKKYILALCCAASVAHGQVLVDFGSDTLANFTKSNNGTPASDFTWGAGVGVGGGGGVSVSTDTGGANYNYNTSFDLGAGSASNTWTISSFFQTNAATGTGPNQVAGIGFGTDTTVEFGTAAVNSLAMTLRYPGSGAAGTVQLAVANNTGTNTNTLQGSSFTAATNNWYKLTLALTKTATANTFSLSGSIENWGTTGGTLSSTVQSFTDQTFTNASLYADTSVYGGFFARQTSGNPIQMAAVDNFQIVPEPSTWALLSLGILAIGGAARRRRS